MEIEGTIAGEMKENGIWVLLSPSNSASVICKGLDNDMGSLENPQISQIWEKPEDMEKEKNNFGCEIGNSSSSQEIEHKCDCSVSNTDDAAKSSEDSGRKNGFMVFDDRGNNFETLGSHGIADNNAHQETIEAEVHVDCKKGSQLDNQNSHSEFGPNSTKTSSMPKNQTTKMGSNKGIALNKKSHKRLRRKRHRPKVFDESKPKKPSTPKPKPPKHAKYVKKNRLKTSFDPLKDVDCEAISGQNINYCKPKPEEEPKVDVCSKFTSLQVYQRRLKPNECLQNSRKLGPNCPRIFKKTRSRRQRACEFDKFVILLSMISPARMDSEDSGSSFESWELHGRPKGIIDGISDDRPNQKTIEVQVPFVQEKGSQRHNYYSDCGLEMSPTKASISKNQTSKKRRNNGIDLNKKPRKRLRIKRYRPKVFDKSKPMKPSTPKPQTPRPARYVKKDRHKPHNGNSCRHKLDLNMDNCVTYHDSKVCDELGDKTKEEQNLDAGRRFSSLKVYKRVLRLNECLKNSRKLGPNCPRIFKKTRLRRQRATVFEKFVIILTEEQEMAEISEPLDLYPKMKDIKKRSKTSRQRQKSLRVISLSIGKMMGEAIEHPPLEKCTFKLTWTANSKKKRSKRSTHRRDLSFFINDLPKIQLSKNFLRKALDANGEKFAYGVERLQGNVVLCNRSIQKYPIKFGVCTPRTGIDLPKCSVGNDTLDYQVVKGQRVVANDVREIGSSSDKYLSYDKYQCQYKMNNFPACFRQQEVTMLKCTEHSLVDLCHEQENVFPSPDDDSFKAALVDFAVQRMEGLHIDDTCKQLVLMNQNANASLMESPHIDEGCKQLVVQDKDAHGALVPSTGNSDHSKKHKKLPMVDLDDETMRVWNLLMENNGSEHFEPEDDDKEKHWREQRDIFSGRAELFISCMHLFQGDRRFSPWKGSVVDSVVGVFLTQNVSDHLSSSAFMELKSRYPPPSVRDNRGFDGRTDHVIHEIQQITTAETSSDESNELSIIRKVPSSSPDHQNPENGGKTPSMTESTSETKKGKQENTINWDELRKKYSHGTSRRRPDHTLDSVNWEAVRKASVQELAKVIASRGMYNQLAGRIKNFLDRIVRDHGSIDLEWLRDVPPEKVKEYLLSIPGLGLKSVECVRLLTLHHHAFPVDTNVGRILVRLGWVPLQPLPGDVQIHLLEEYPQLDNIQKYIWPRLCHLRQLILYELHYHMITFGKIFCTKRSPKCNACPMRAECRHYASAFASQRLRLKGPRAKNTASEPSLSSDQDLVVHRNPPVPSRCDNDCTEGRNDCRYCEPIVEIPASPEPYVEERDIEDFYFDSECDDEIPTIKLNSEEFRDNVPSLVNGYDGVSKALVTVRPEIASLPVRKLKTVNRLRTVHQVYELPDSHPLLAGFDEREPEDCYPYLLRIWMPDEASNSSQVLRRTCNCKELTTCDRGTCSREIVKYQNNQIVRGTILIPCRTANGGSFPLNGTYFQKNEVFADLESSLRPIAVPREWIWNLRRRSLYCGTSATSISRGMSQEDSRHWLTQGFLCIRAMDGRTKGPKPLPSSFHWWKTKHADDE